jgi:hydrogenase maturation protease
MGEVELVTMIPEDIIEVRNGLTDTIRERMPALLEETLSALAEEGIVLVPKVPPVSFREVIHACANPMTQRLS